MMDVTLRKRADKTEELLGKQRVHESQQVHNIGRHETTEFLPPEVVRDRSFVPCDVGYTWSRNRTTDPSDRADVDVDPRKVADLPADLSIGTNVWFRLRFTIPASMAGRPVSLRFVAVPLGTPRGGDPSVTRRVEAMCFRDGEPWQAFDGGRSDLPLTDEAAGGEEFDLLVEVGTTSLWGGLNVEKFKLTAAYIYSTRPVVDDLYRNVRMLNDLRKSVGEDSPNHGKILQGIYRAYLAYPFQSDDGAELRAGATEALEELAAVKESLTGDVDEYELKTIGHAHLDVAWRWPWSETVRKCGRTFSNVLSLFDEYPEFRFVQSQPILYEFVRDRYPGVLERIREHVDEGRWVPEGALWLESDVNIPGGESLARQYLHGTRYFRDELGVDPKVTFLPDCFGFSPGLPGIAADAGCPYFMTQKMSWNETNQIPHNTFRWEGIDGSELLAHFPPADTYNGKMSVDEVRGAVDNFSESATIDEAAYLVGWGDGGGGPTRDMLENRRIIDETGALPDVSFESLVSFFEGLEDHWTDLPTWTGELYFERHRGTLTTQAETKRNNRRGEFTLREAEWWASVATATVPDYEYPKDRLDGAWELLLFNQFHDVLPGSSITDVYRDADREYDHMFEEVSAVLGDARAAVLGTADDPDRLCVTNSLSWSRDAVVVAEDDVVGPETRLRTEEGDPVAVQPAGSDPDRLLVEAPEVPSMGARTLVPDPEAPPVTDEFDVSESVLENAVVRVELDDDGTLASVYDKKADREGLDGPGNRLVCYRDIPAEFDAWDIEEDVYATAEQLPAPTDVDVVETGPVRGMVRQTHRFGDSVLVQEVALTRGSKAVEFRTYVDWQEEERLLKAHFPVGVHADSATYETHFGHHQRSTHSNTSWDQARFEEPHQKWVDVAEYDYGAAVLNDGKYGVHVDGTDVGLSLLRAPTYPDPEADRGEHRFSYAFLPHEGDFRDAGVVEAAYELNAPAHAVPVDHPVDLRSFSVDDAGVVVEATKRAEDDPDALVVRLYEAWGRSTSARVAVGFPVAGAAETNVVEDESEPLPVEGDEIPVSFDPFEIKSLVVELGDR